MSTRSRSSRHCSVHIRPVARFVPTVTAQPAGPLLAQLPVGVSPDARVFSPVPEGLPSHLLQTRNQRSFARDATSDRHYSRRLFDTVVLDAGNMYVAPRGGPVLGRLVGPLVTGRPPAPVNGFEIVDLSRVHKVRITVATVHVVDHDGSIVVSRRRPVDPRTPFADSHASVFLLDLFDTPDAPSTRVSLVSTWYTLQHIAGELPPRTVFEFLDTSRREEHLFAQRILSVRAGEKPRSGILPESLEDEDQARTGHTSWPEGIIRAGVHVPDDARDRLDHVRYSRARMRRTVLAGVTWSLLVLPGMVALLLSFAGTH